MVLFSSAIIICAENNNSKELDQRIAQYKKVINERQNKQRWLWNAASVVGPLGLVALGVYQWYKSSPINVEKSKMSFQRQQPERELDVTKYFKASKAYGASAVYFSILSLFDPFFYPYVAATYMGSLYYGIKGVRPRLNSVALDEIIITPLDFPY